MTASLFAGTGTLARVHLRTGWRTLASWTGLMIALVLATASSLKGLYPTLAERLAYAESTASSPAVAAFNGRAYGLPELGAIVSYEVGFMALLGFPVIAVHLAIHFGRREEDAGRTEVITAGRLGRLAPLAANALVILASLTFFAIVVALGLQAIGLPAAGSWRYAAGLALFAAAFAAIGLLAGEVSREARTAYGVSLLAIAATFLVRALVDGRAWNATGASPSGWLAELRPWSNPQWWPVAAYLGLIVACAGGAAAIAARRDLGGGLLATRPGPAYGSPAIGSPVGFAWRFLARSWWGWLVGIVVWNAAFGSLSGEMTEIVAANPTLLEALGVDQPEHVLTSLSLLLCGVGACAFGVSAISRLAAEEVAGRLGLVLSTRVPPHRIWIAWLAVSVIGAVLILLAGAATLGAVTVWSTGESANLGQSLRAAGVVAAPVVFATMVAAALLSVTPRATPAGWLIVGWIAVVGVLAETLRLPGWARDLSPVHAVGNVPIADPRWGIVLIVASAAVVLGVLGLVRFRRRDLAAG